MLSSDQDCDWRDAILNKNIDRTFLCGNLRSLRRIFDMTEDRTLFLIPDVNLKKFEAACLKLSRKAVKIGCEEIKPFVFGHTMQTLLDGRLHRVYEVLFTVEAPKVNGYTFVAHLDHSNETGNIIRMVPNTIDNLPEHFRTCAPACQHCNINRRRRDTFVLRCDADSSFKQVGTTCLKDFFGHDPMKMARMAELLGYAHEAARSAEHFSEGGMTDLRWLSVSHFCELTASAIREFGWVSGKAAYENPALTSTKNIALNRYLLDGYIPTEEDKTLAANALAWAQALSDKEEKSDYEHNILVIAEAEVMEFRSMGLAASIVGMYVRHCAKEAERAEKARAQANSTFVGTVGEKIKNIPVTIVGVSSTQGNYGTSFIYRMLTDDGNVMTWFASNSLGVVEGAKMTLVSGTVKAHQTYRDVSQTVLTRCKMVSA